MRTRFLIPSLLACGLITACGDSTGDGTGDEGLESIGPTTGITETATETADGTGDTTSSTTAETTGDGDGDGGGCMADTDCTNPANPKCDMESGLCGPDCGDVNVTLEAEPPPVMLVLDKSGSMVTNSWDHDSDPGTPVETRWATLHRVTTFVLNGFENGIDFGAQLFPSTAACPQSNCYNGDACLVNAAPEVGIAGSNGAAILAGIPVASAGAGVIKGGTPARAGILSAVDALNASANVGQPSIIFVTDGAANCGTDTTCVDAFNCPLLEVYDTALETEVAAAFASGITTYVVGIDIIDAVVGTGPGEGIPTANPNEELNKVALAGGAPAMGGADSFYNATNEAELQAALELIVGEVATCSIDLTKPPNTPPTQEQIDQNKVVFDIGGDVPRLDGVDLATCQGGTVDGWIWVVEGELVEFCGSFCDTLKSTGVVDGTYECPGVG